MNQELLRDDYSFKKAEEIQIKFQNLIKRTSKNDNISDIKHIRTIAGLDLSYFKEKNCEYGIACAVIWNLKENVEENHFFTKELIKFPYKPGYLGFRECKTLAHLILNLPIKPDLIMCDGHGIIHPRRFGEAVHLGFALDISSIGVAKNFFIGFSDWDKLEKIKGNKSPIWSKDPEILVNEKSNELLGYAVCLNDGSKPVFISTGYKITLDIALRVCLDTNKGHQQPEPLYLADHYSRKKIKTLY